MRNIPALLLISLFFSCRQTNLTVQPGEKLVWADEFNHSGPPDTNRWSYDLGDGCPALCGWGNEEQEYYTDNHKNVRVENGLLIIEAIKEEKEGKHYTSARLVSKGKGDWLYGRIEIKARLPEGRGTLPALWMLSSDKKYTGWPTSGEIDIMEHVGHQPGMIHGTLHSEKYNHTKGTQQEGKVMIPDCDRFHVYTLNWTKGKIDFYVDDQLYQSVIHKPDDDYRGWPFDQRFHLIMNIAIGGTWAGLKGIDEATFPQRMEIDYVRVYQ